MEETKQVKKSKKVWWISGTSALVVIILGGGVVAFAKPFASGKQLVLDAVSSQTKSVSANTPTVEEDITLHVEKMSLPPMMGPMSATLGQLNGATIELDLLTDMSNHEVQATLNSTLQSQHHHGEAWVTKNSATLALSDYQSILGSALPPGVTLPKYLVIDGAQAQSIQSFWSQVDASRKSMTDKQFQSLQKTEEILINAIPDQYIHRKGLNTIEISFDQKGLEDIVQSEIKAAYQNKDQIADTLAQLSKGNQPQATVKQNILNAFNQTPEQSALDAVKQALASGTVTLKPTTIDVTKAIFSKHVTEKIVSGVSVSAPNQAANITLGVNVNASSPATGSIQVPSAKAHGSENLQSWLASGN